MPDASPTVKGIVELATTTEVTDGVLGDKAVTPLTLKQSLGSISNVPVGGILQYGGIDSTYRVSYLQWEHW